MKTKAVRLYGKYDLRLEEFELPPLKEDEILAHVICDSTCMSSHKAVEQGANHKRVPADINKNPTIIGHEFSGDIIEVGKKWQEQFSPGDKFSIQPALNCKGSLDAPGYSYRYIGGDATYIIIPNEVMECRCLLKYDGEGYFPASLSEPMSCIVGAFNASYHTTPGSYVHHMGIKNGGNMALLASAGPMGLGALDYAIHSENKPLLLVVMDIDEKHLKWAESIFPPREAEEESIKLIYINSLKITDIKTHLLECSGHKGFDDVFVFAPVESLIELGDAILKPYGCLNFFAGPNNPEFTARINFYNVHYSSTHITATSSGNTEDMRAALYLIGQKLIKPAVMITHIGGLNTVADTIINLPQIPGGKKLIYTNIKLDLMAIEDFKKLQDKNPLFKGLYHITKKNRGLWSLEAEECLLANAE
ncbi:MAG TPA: zinc-binding dehydrogenase, partial [Candidatus Humimicrobiaceae bacterium]|nr:zinc-binding dehydrogenase [Candidatus Humimicrobiaceae bacterium]